MPDVFDPQNPVHFVPNAELPTVMDPSSPAFGLAPGISDGPLAQKVGRIVTPPTVQVTGKVATPSGAVNLGGFQFVAEGASKPVRT